MALRGDRYFGRDTIDFFLHDVAEAGQFVVFGPGGGSGSTSMAGSGVPLDQAGFQCSLAGNPSGLKALGCLMNNQVNIDLTRQHINYHKPEEIIGGKCVVWRQGRVYTNKVSGTPSPGNKAYLTSHGQVTPTVSSTGGTAATPLVGEFYTSKDESGYAGVEINLPQG